MSRKNAGLNFYLICCATLLLLFSSFVTQVQLQRLRAQQAPAASAALPAGRGDGEANSRQAGQLLALLNLSPAQRAEIRAIRENSETERRTVMQRLRRAQRALERAIYIDNATEAELERYVQEAAAAQAAAIRLRALTELKIRRVLTDKQLEVLRELRRQARAKQAEALTNSNNTRVRPRN